MPPVTAADIAAKNGPGSMYAVGSPGQVVEKLLHQHEVLGHQRAMLQLAVGPVGHRDVMRTIELLGTEVAPVVRTEAATESVRNMGDTGNAAAPNGGGSHSHA
ncbi:hypothetical protein SAZ11_59805 [Streptomyces sp. FXJ1.4098]|nr:hypothetical protein [Streptomyces sp. FXJ1.4098]